MQSAWASLFPELKFSWPWETGHSVAMNERKENYISIGLRPWSSWTTEQDTPIISLHKRIVSELFSFGYCVTWYLHVTLVIGFGGGSTDGGPDSGTSGSGIVESWIKSGEGTAVFMGCIILVTRHYWVITLISSLCKSLQKAFFFPSSSFFHEH